MTDLLRLARTGGQPSEHQIQSAFFTRLALSPWKDLPIFAVPNFAGHHGNEKARLASGARSKAEGRKKGVPDIVVACPRADWPGLYLETKKPDGNVSLEQREWFHKLMHQGYAVGVCRSADELWAALSHYLGERWTIADQWVPGRYTPGWKP